MSSLAQQLRGGLQLHQAGDLEGAAAVYRQVLAIRKDQSDAMHLLGLVLYQTGKITEALAHLRSALGLQPGNPAYSNSLGVALLALRQVDEAIGYFRRALQLKPDYADAHSNLGNALFEKGLYDQAATSCREALRIASDHADALYNLGNALCAQRRLETAIESYRGAIRLRPRFPKALNNLAGALVLQGRWEEAVEQYRQAIAQDPNFAEAHKNLGSVLKDHGRVEDAIASFRAALKAKPEYPDALNRLGIALFEHGRHEEAMACYRKAIDIDPELVEAYNNLGALFTESGRHEEAVVCCQQALAIRPLSAEVHYNLGNALKAQGKLHEAAASYRRALDIQPDHPKANNNLGNTLRLLGKFPEAVRCYRKALATAPGDPVLLDNLGAAYKQMGLVEEAAEAYRRSLPLRAADPLYELRIEALCPPVFSSAEEIGRFHERLHAALDRCLAMDIRTDPMAIAGIGCEPPFDAAYHGRDERLLREKFAALFRGCFSAASPRPPSAEGRPRVAMLVTRDHEGIFLRCTRGLIEHLDPERFDLSIVCAESGLARVRSEVANPRVKYVPVPDNFEKTTEIIRGGRFDLLYFWEVGSDPFNYFLPFLRLAPVQCVGWGTAYTTGVPEIDYHISSDLIEIPEAQEHYTERLVRLTTLPTYQYRPGLQQPGKDRTAFGISDSQQVYLCTQNVRKLHPDLDPLLGEILRRDPAGVLVLLKPEHEHMEATLRDRFQRTVGDLVDRILFVPRMPHADYLNLVAAGDVLLDPRPYGSGVTAYDGFSLGKPIVTFPTQYQRGRYAYGCYRKMGILDCVASSAQEYVELAVRLGTDLDWRRSISEKILAASQVLFDDLDVVRQHEQFFEQALRTAGFAER
jgi:protein O-GlcNAc transferase